MRQIVNLPVAKIAPRANPLRPIDPDYAAAIAVSMAEATQLQPIIVRPVAGERPYEVVCGGHRHHAAIISGIAFIDAEIREMTDGEARIAEIDENVVRKELSALDRALSLAERKRLYEETYPEAKHGGDRKKKSAKDQVANMATWSRYSKDAAKKTGLSERSIQRATELASKFPPDLIALVRGTKLADNAAALKKLCRLPEDQRRAAVEAMAAGEAKSIAGALAARGYAEPIATDPALALTARFIDLLSRTSAGQRREWLLLILRQAKGGELPALAQGLAARLSAKGQKLVFDALTAVVKADDDAEAA